MAVTDIEGLAREKLGRTRILMRGELSRTREALRPGERVLGMAVGGRGLTGRLIVVTDQRFLLVGSKCEDVPYERLISVKVDGTSSCSAAEFVVATRDQTHSFLIAPQGRAVELARLAAPRLEAERVSIKGVAPGRTGGARHSRGPVARTLSILVSVAVGVLVFVWPFGDDSDGGPRRAPVFAAGGCVDLNGALVSCDEPKVGYKLVARPAGARRCSQDSRAFSFGVGKKVGERLKDRRLCLELYVGGEE